MKENGAVSALGNDDDHHDCRDGAVVVCLRLSGVIGIQEGGGCHDQMTVEVVRFTSLETRMMITRIYILGTLLL